MRTSHPLHALLALAALAAAVPSRAVVVGGVDFGGTGLFSHVETGTMVASYVRAAGDVVTRYGVIGTVNGDATYCADGTANCALYYFSTATVSAVSGNALYFADTRTTLYFGNGPAIDLRAQDSAANIAAITGMTAWATFKGENGVDGSADGLVADSEFTQALNGSAITASGGGLMSVDLGDGLGDAAVEAFLDAGSIPVFGGGFADINLIVTLSNASLNPFDIAGPGADSCRTGTPQVGDFCLAGDNLDLRGRTVVTGTVPSPGTLALLAAGLAGLCATRGRLGLRPS